MLASLLRRCLTDAVCREDVRGLVVLRRSRAQVPDHRAAGQDGAPGRAPADVIDTYFRSRSADVPQATTDVQLLGAGTGYQRPLLSLLMLSLLR